MNNNHVAILAGAGTGKTSRIIKAIIKLLEGPEDISPNKILAVTFGRRAANDLRQRLRNELKKDADEITISTFHALAARIIRTHSKYAGVTPDFTILHKGDVLPILKRIISEEQLSGMFATNNDAFEAIERYKCKGTLPESITAEDKETKAIVRLYAKLQAELLASKSMTFSDLIVYALHILKKQPDISRKYSEQFQHIFVDEFQDTNIAQYKLLKRLAEQDSKLFVVGDDDQSIFSWRYVPPRMMDRFMEDYGIEEYIPLTKNHRSTATIVRAADGLISHNKDRIDKKLVPTHDEGALIRVKRMVKQEEEATWIASKITRIRKKEENEDKTIAILCRHRELFRKIEKRLRDADIEYHTLDRESLYDKSAAQLLLNYLRAVTNSKNTIAIKHIINTPSRRIGKEATDAIEDCAKRENISYWDAAIALSNAGELSAHADTFIKQFTAWQEYATTAGHSVKKLAKRIYKQAEFKNYIEGDNKTKAKEKAKNRAAINTMLATMKPTQSLPEFLDAMMDEKDNDTANADVVHLMTMHAAKGLEFDYVFLPAWEEKRVPYHRSPIEEERRLAFVGITRAKQRVFISNTLEDRDGLKIRFKEIKPSRFISELPEDCIEKKRSLLASAWLHNHRNYVEPTFDIEVDDIVSHNPHEDSEGDIINHGVCKVISIAGGNIEIKLNNGSIKTVKKSEVTKVLLPSKKQRQQKRK